MARFTPITLNGQPLPRPTPTHGVSTAARPIGAPEVSAAFPPDPLSPPAQPGGEGPNAHTPTAPAAFPNPQSPFPLAPIAQSLLDPTKPLEYTARLFHLSESDLLTLLNNETLQQLLTNLSALNDLRHRASLNAATKHAVDRLQSLCDQEDPVESRRAASAITRITHHSHRATKPISWFAPQARGRRNASHGAAPDPAAPSAHSATLPLGHSATSPKLPRPRELVPQLHDSRPCPRLKPQHVVATALAHLKDPDDPRAGLHALFNFCTPRARCGHRDPADFVKRMRQKLGSALDFQTALASPVERRGSTAFQTVHLNHQNAAPVTAHFTLQYLYAGEHIYSWLIDSLELDDTPPPDDDENDYSHSSPFPKSQIRKPKSQTAPDTS